jgi:hypothetical protein
MHAQPIAAHAVHTGVLALYAPEQPLVGHIMPQQVVDELCGILHDDIAARRPTLSTTNCQQLLKRALKGGNVGNLGAAIAQAHEQQQCLVPEDFHMLTQQIHEGDHA